MVIHEKITYKLLKEEIIALLQGHWDNEYPNSGKIIVDVVYPVDGEMSYFDLVL